ncbi:hypothetical protein Q31a_19610 [Aureliella helgolandensis]|uniref:Uncharacterized protein n=1 Tax=Aureliella helgolandensis TaxID=2527968 RepID=A0A518G4Y4_9BACT|nr:hypothetical protein Q31a_19610 [Aureliella helgolandensis]
MGLKLRGRRVSSEIAADRSMYQGGELDNSRANQHQGGLTGPSFRLSFIETKFH